MLIKERDLKIMPLDLKTYFKPTNSFMYLHRESCLCRHVFTGFIKGEAIRHIPNANDKNELQAILSSFKLNLMKRGYNELEIDDNINQALSNRRAEFLNKKSKKHRRKFLWCFQLNITHISKR